MAVPLGMSQFACAAPLCFAVGDLAPFGMPGIQSKVAGLTADVAVALQRQTGISLTLRRLPLVRVLHELNTGQCDLTLLLPTTRFTAQVIDLGELARVEILLLPRRGLELPASGPLRKELLRGLRLVSFAGSAVWGDIDSFEQVEHVRVSSLTAALGMLKAERADFTLLMRQVLDYGLTQPGQSLQDFGPPRRVGDLPLHLYVGPAVTTAQRVSLTEALRALRGTPQLQALLGWPTSSSSPASSAATGH